MKPCVVRIVCPAGVQLMDLAGTIDVFLAANAVGAGRYDVGVVALTERRLADVVGLSLTVGRGIDDVGEPVDTLVVAGPSSPDPAPVEEAALMSLRRLAARARRVAGVCTGSLLLARAGVFDGRRATMHWELAEQAAVAFPRVAIASDQIFVRDGSISTCAGATAGIDLGLAFVEEDLGREAALRVARRLVVYLSRDGSQAQLSAPLRAQVGVDSRFGRVVAWVRENPGGDLRIRELARRAHLSERQFTRAFRARLGQSPARFVEAVRLEAARAELESAVADPSIEEVAWRAGFSSAEVFRRAFLRRLGTSPSEYRAQFSQGRRR